VGDGALFGEFRVSGRDALKVTLGNVPQAGRLLVAGDAHEVRLQVAKQVVEEGGIDSVSRCDSEDVLIQPPFRASPPERID